MPASFPTSIKSFTTKANNVDTIDASHINDMQDEITAIETLLGANSTRVTTWTPTFVPSAGSFASITYASTNVGYQMRIGGIVFIQGVVSITAINTTGATGNIRIGGLPLGGVANASAISVSQSQNWTTANPIAGRTNGSQIQLFTNYIFGEVPIANIQATSNLVFSLFYFHTGT